MSELALKGGPPAVPEGMIKPWPWITEEDKQAIRQALEEATPWRYPFPQVTALEKEWAEFVGMKYCLATNSGTSALHLAVAAAQIGPGDEVLVPAFTFLASASCVLHSNGIPIFVDIDPRTCCIDPRKIEEQITDRTKAIVAVDIHGLPADYEEIHALARKHGLLVIEDGAQAHGAEYKGRPVGALGDLAGCSLNGSKNLSALGEGGLFTTNEQRHFELASRVRMFGEVVRPGEPRQYNAYIMGWNYRTDNLQAAFARSQLKRLPEMTAARVRNCNYLTEHLREMPGLEPPYVPPDRTHSYFFYVLRVKPERAGVDLPPAAFRDALIKVLRAEGVPVQRWQTVPVPGQSLFQFRDGYGKGCPWSCPYARPGIEYHPEDYPQAQRLIEEFLCLGHSGGGLGPPNGLDLMERYVAAFHKALGEHLDEVIKLAREEG
ncbi:MAG TPA: DegT/DnrJ/EryC1/StrS family aminotransferase [Armatimonadetes bacterium]|nr:DegT/DnrJ/EryC1/StrS family aminotransferase [Armatimonadota bacterium]